MKSQQKVTALYLFAVSITNSEIFPVMREKDVYYNTNAHPANLGNALPFNVQSDITSFLHGLFALSC